MKRILAFLALFTSLSTIVCCALPALFVVLGFGAAFAGLVSAVPQLIWISENKIYFFVTGAVLLAAGGWLQWRARNAACPTDACRTTRDWSMWVYFGSLGLYAIGFLFSFIAELVGRF